MFRLRKLYADIVLDDGTVTVIYLTWLEAWGARFSSAGVERYGPDGHRVVRHARPPAWEFDPDSLRDGWRLRLELADGTLELRFDNPLGPRRPSGAPLHLALDWRVLIPRAAAVGRWTSRSDGGAFSGQGYCDWVELHAPPRFLGLRQLRWGRVHLPSETLVFTALRFRSRGTWSQVMRWRGAGSQPDEGVAVEFDEAGGVRIGAPGAAPLALAATRVLHDGPALDGARFPTAALRLLVQALTGPLHERRWLATSTGPRVESGWGLHEVVHFGAPGHAQAGDL